MLREVWTQFNRHCDQEAALLLDSGVRPSVYRSGPDLPCRQLTLVSYGIRLGPGKEAQGLSFLLGADNG